jgi:hypothetical protein
MKELKKQNEEIAKILEEMELNMIQNIIQFKTFRNQTTQEDEIIIDSIYDCQFIHDKNKISIHKGINKISNSQLSTERCKLKGGQRFRAIIEEQYNLIILTVFNMIDW